MVGNPVNAGTGNKYLAETDYRNSAGLEFTRHYNSNALSSGVFGRRWNAYNQLRVISETNVLVTRSDQRAYNFNLVQDVWTAYLDIADKLEAIKN
ncbi:MAG: DUF6531 domain-containing protein [Thiobacillaceae bacterium]|nr:DUF6531 domain-containing protein [Thiobacillaceae bacterium]